MRVADCIERIRAAKPRVTVVGDFLLDGWWAGRVERLAREAPVPVVDVVDRHHVPGGAANAAVNLAAMGARVQAVGVVGEDEPGEELRDLLRAAGVDVTRLRRIDGAVTTTKVRVQVGGQVMLRVDRAQPGVWPRSARRHLVDAARDALASSDALLVCDYGSRALDDGVVAELAGVPRPDLVVVDAHDPRRWQRLRPDVVTPNAAEAERVPGVALGDGDTRALLASRASPRLLRETGAGAVLVTLDRSGTVLLQRDRTPFRTFARPAPEQQASGAGDVFAAAFTVARVGGAPIEAAADFAQHAADVAVAKAGTCVCALNELAAR